MGKYTIIGGDLRNLELAKKIQKDGNDVNIYGFLKELIPNELISQISLNESIKNSDIIIVPILFSEDDKHINTPFGIEKIKIADVIDKIEGGQTVVGGNIGEELRDILNRRNISYVNILEKEEMAVPNAVATAESAIGIAIKNTQITLHDNNCMVLGFGRIGKNLAKMLHGIGSNVYVAVRKKEDLAWIKAYNYNGILLQNLGQIVGKIDVLFNTIPKKIITRKNFKNLGKQVLIIDLASGIDDNITKEMGLNLIKAQGLPGKMASRTCAEYIKEIIYEIKKEREVITC